MTRSASCRLVLIAGSVLLGVFASTALADKVLYKDGRAPVEGTIVEKNDERIVIQTKFGQVTIAMKDVLRVETGKTAAETFKEKWAAVDQSKVADLMALATWCEENGLSRETKKIYRRVVEIDPNHETAHRGLGDLLVDGKWVTKKDVDAQEKARKDAEKKEKADADRAKKPAAASKKGGKPGAETKVDTSGEVGPFLAVIEENKEEDETLRASLEDYFGQKFTAHTSERFSLRAQIPNDENTRLLSFAERMLVTINKLFSLEPSHVPWQGQYVWFSVKQKGTYTDLIEWVDKNMFELDNESKKFFKDGGGLIADGPPPLSAKLEGDIPLDHQMSNEIGNMWVVYYSKRAARNWLSEGFGAYTAILEFGVNDVWHVTNTKYAGRTDLADKNADMHLRLVCHDIIAGATEKLHPFAEIFKKKLNDLDYADLAKSWSLVDFLMTDHRDQFHDFIKKLRGYPDDETALREVFGWTTEDLESKWKDYVLKNYPNK